MRDAERLSTLVQLVGDEAMAQRPGRELVLTHLVEVLLVEALRATPREDAPPGLLRGLADARLAPAMRELHGQVERSWTVPSSPAPPRSRARRSSSASPAPSGVPPMEYLLAWRMALAKDLLGRGELALAEIAERIGYGSASSFSTAFSRYVGVPPSRYAR